MSETTDTTVVVDETPEVSKMDKVKEFGRKHWKKLAVGTAAVAGATIAVAAFWTSDEDDETLLIEGNSTDLDDVDVEHEPTTDDALTEDA